MNPAAATRGLHWPSVAFTLAASAIATISWKGFTRWWASRNRAEARAKLNATAASSFAAASSSASSAAVSPAQSSSLLDFLLIVGRCKVEKRTGWVNDEVPLPESVSDHMFRMSVMAMCCANDSALPADAASSSSAAVSSQLICPARAVRMALVHDLAESLVGDITPTQFSGVSKADKSKQESDAMHTIAAKLAAAHGSAAAPSSSAAFTGVAAEVLALWQEYESGATPTAQFVKNLDKTEMYVQAFEYQQAAAQAQATAAQSGDAEAEAAAAMLQRRLNRFYQSMEETRLKAIAQDEARGAPAQNLIIGVITELQRRIASAQVASDALSSAVTTEAAASMIDAAAAPASTSDSFVFVADDGLSMEEKRAMQYAHNK